MSGTGPRGEAAATPPESSPPSGAPAGSNETLDGTEADVAESRFRGSAGHRPGTTCVAARLLGRSWRVSGSRLDQRCSGLSDEEYLWCPEPAAWTVRPDPEWPGRWTYDYDFAPPPPAPITSIAWRTVHLIADNEIYWEHAFGPGTRNFLDLEVPSTARRAMELWRASCRPVARWLETATDEDLLEPRPSHLGVAQPAGEVVRILLDEQTHHGAEIALLRDLYLRQQPGTGVPQAPDH